MSETIVSLYDTGIPLVPGSEQEQQILNEINSGEPIRIPAPANESPIHAFASNEQLINRYLGVAIRNQIKSVSFKVGMMTIRVES